jgi:hypothetical protein
MTNNPKKAWQAAQTALSAQGNDNSVSSNT